MAIYAIDFDNTLAITRFPEIVAPNKKMVAFAKAVKAQGHQIILWTSRAGADLENAVEWCRLQGLVFDAVNEPLTWTKSKLQSTTVIAWTIWKNWQHQFLWTDYKNL